MAKKDKNKNKEKRPLFTVTVYFYSNEKVFESVIATRKDEQYDNFMIIEQANRNSTYINMSDVQELKIGVMDNE